MKVRFSSSKLQEILDICSKFVSKSSTLPVLENIYISWSVDKVVFRWTDMEKYVELEVNAEIEGEWSITINSKTFQDIIRNIDADEVDLTIDQDNEELKINSWSDDFKIKGIPASEYVAVPEVDWENQVLLNPSIFSKGVSKVEYAISERNFTPILTGMLMRLRKEENANKLIFVWTDSFRLAEYKVDYEWETENIDLVVPKIHIQEIKKVVDYFVGAGWDSMKISYSNNLVSFDFELEDIKIHCTSVLIQGNFPDYENESIMPTSFNTSLNLSSDFLESAIKKVSIFTRDINNFVDVNITDSEVEINSWETDKWHANTSIKAEVSWEKVNFWINWKYVQDYIKILEGSILKFNIVNQESPIVLEDENDQNSRYVIRPVIK